MYDLLNSISSPADLRQLDRKHLKVLATELREFILESVSKTGGHLASNLGAIELTIALHYVYNTPHDLLVWDVGHQSYPHKILTGRREGMAKLRMKGGLAGFPKREESEYDTFGVGHSSTSISAALGMAVASKLKGDNRHALAIIGDGAMTAGMAFEALNNAGAMDANMLVVNGGELHEILRPARERIKGVFHGHIHQSLQIMKDGICYTAVPSTYSQFTAWPTDETAVRDPDYLPSYNFVQYLPDGQTIVHQHTFPV